MPRREILLQRQPYRKTHHLATTDKDAAQQIVRAKNQVLRQPTLNLQIARALEGSPYGFACLVVMNAVIKHPGLSFIVRVERRNAEDDAGWNPQSSEDGCQYTADEVQEPCTLL